MVFTELEEQLGVGVSVSPSDRQPSILVNQIETRRVGITVGREDVESLTVKRLYCRNTRSPPSPGDEYAWER
jgi:hypothetical protein